MKLCQQCLKRKHNTYGGRFITGIFAKLQNDWHCENLASQFIKEKKRFLFQIELYKGKTINYSCCLKFMDLFTLKDGRTFQER